MKIHEYQAKEFLRHYGIPVPRGSVAFTPEEAQRVARDLATPVVVVKAQILAGGRGKGGGVKVLKDRTQVYETAQKLLGSTLVTPQTGPAGQRVEKVLVEEGVDIEREMYVGIVLDRARGLPVVMASAAGGMDIEEVARTSPAQIYVEPLDPPIGIRAFKARRLAKKLGLLGKLLPKGADFIVRLAQAYLETDATLVEMNPFVVTKKGDLLSLDAKWNIDDSALFRHGDYLDLQDPAEEDEAERQAKRHDLSYVSMKGNIGCMVNGAGLAMATMDAIKMAGGEPANFLDVGGGASQEKVTAAFRIILMDPDVRAILVNIFGGIMKCDVIARGISDAVREVGLKVPLVVRLEGTNVDEGRRILGSSGLRIERADGMNDAAEKVAAAARGAPAGKAGKGGAS